MVDFIFATAVVLLLLTRRSSASVILWNLPATFAHELAHWLVALATGSRPGLPSLWPRRLPGGRGWRAGSVEFTPKPFWAAWVALAPLALALIAAWGLLRRPPVDAFFFEAGIGCAFGFLAWGALPSSQDWFIAVKYPAGFFTAIAAFASGALSLGGYY